MCVYEQIRVSVCLYKCASVFLTANAFVYMYALCHSVCPRARVYIFMCSVCVSICVIECVRGLSCNSLEHLVKSYAWALREGCSCAMSNTPYIIYIEHCKARSYIAAFIHATYNTKTFSIEIKKCYHVHVVTLVRV